MSTEPHAPNPHAARLRQIGLRQAFTQDERSCRLAADLIDAAVRWRKTPSVYDHNDDFTAMLASIDALTTPRPGAEDATP